MMVTCGKVAQAAAITRMRDDYLPTLVAPIDGMWEEAVIARATFWELRDGEHYAGYCCSDADNVLLRFFLVKNYQQRAQAILRWFIATNGITQSIAGTNEPFYFSLCLDMQPSITPHSYLFRDNQHVTLPLSLDNGSFSQAAVRDLDAITRFYRANTAGAGEWIAAFLHERLSRDELFVVRDQHEVIAAGECIPSQQQAPYADLGMVVAQAYRGRGLGSYVLTQMKQHCAIMGWQPICACAADNHASKRAIEKAGFISAHRMMKLGFSQHGF